MTPLLLQSDLSLNSFFSKMRLYDLFFSKNFQIQMSSWTLNNVFYDQIHQDFGDWSSLKFLFFFSQKVKSQKSFKYKKNCQSKFRNNSIYFVQVVKWDSVRSKCYYIVTKLSRHPLCSRLKTMFTIEKQNNIYVNVYYWNSTLLFEQFNISICLVILVCFSLSILLTKKKKKKNTISNMWQLAFDDVKIFFHSAIEFWYAQVKEDWCTKPWTGFRIKDVPNAPIIAYIRIQCGKLKQSAHKMQRKSVECLH